MPLEPYQRNGKWWARGRIEHNGAAITGYTRYSTKASTEAGAWEWCRQEEARVVRSHLLGPEAIAKEEEQAFTFAEACMLYEPNSKSAVYLLPILEKWGSKPVVGITPKMVRDLAQEVYPEAGTSTWTRQVLTPVRSVINNAHDLGKCPPIKIKGFSSKERTRQDKARGSTGRTKYPPGSWEWMLQFCEHAEKQVRALALTMFCTGARISQAISMRPEHFKPDENKLCVPAAKGLADRWVDIPEWLVAELKELPSDKYPRGWEHKPQNRRLFGYADRSSPRKAWDKAIEKAKIEFIPFHSAGRHGFGQEMNVRHPVDEKAASAFGGWSDIGLMKRTYTHAEEIAEKIHKAQEEGKARAEAKTKLKLRKA